MWKRVLLAVCLVWGSYAWWTTRALSRDPGVLAPAIPIQEAASNVKPFDYKKYRITPLAQYSIEARVLGREDYHLGRESDVSPMDLALGWGPMSDDKVLGKVHISQSNRFYYWTVQEFPIPRESIETNSANTHLIPADATVARKLKQIKKGHIVRLRGYLVRVDAADGWHWISSLARNDVGDGACELLWVQDVAMR